MEQVCHPYDELFELLDNPELERIMLCLLVLSCLGARCSFCVAATLTRYVVKKVAL